MMMITIQITAIIQISVIVTKQTKIMIIMMMITIQMIIMMMITIQITAIIQISVIVTKQTKIMIITQMMIPLTKIMK